MGMVSAIQPDGDFHQAFVRIIVISTLLTRKLDFLLQNGRAQQLLYHPLYRQTC